MHAQVVGNPYRPNAFPLQSTVDTILAQELHQAVVGFIVTNCKNPAYIVCKCGYHSVALNKIACLSVERIIFIQHFQGKCGNRKFYGTGRVKVFPVIEPVTEIGKADAVILPMYSGEQYL